MPVSPWLFKVLICCELCHRKSLENIEENLCREDFVADC